MNQQQYGAMGAPIGGPSSMGMPVGGMLREFGTNPQVVQQHIQQDLGYYGNGSTEMMHYQPMFSHAMSNPIMQGQGYSNQQGYGQGQGMQGQGYSNQQGYGQGQGMQGQGYSNQQGYGQGQGMQGQGMQGQGYSNQQGYGQGQGMQGQGYSNQQGYGQGQGMQGQGMQGQGYSNQHQQGYSPQALQQVMHAAPVSANVMDSYGAESLRYGGGYAGMQGAMQNTISQPYGMGSSILSEYGTNPQVVRQHIAQDLQQGQGAMTSQQAGNRVAEAYQMYGSSIPPQTSQMQHPMGSSMLSQYGTSPQVVQSHIQQDLSSMGYGNTHPMQGSPMQQSWAGRGMM
ncbi:hypothetical protein [Alicyclobacillus sp. SP_1]|uniref:hypothetical protein n=1 Tax=Alicyclobacillus sp. SP_1 TaxID=2942475 RepID=UPI00215869EC|nr:hypothetical protein [Alicyclobacillus sp. SP_1]